MRCAEHTGNSNHYLACRGTKPQKAIDYLFDVLLSPRGRGKRDRDDKKGKKKKQRIVKTNGRRQTEGQTDAGFDK